MGTCDVVSTQMSSVASPNAAAQVYVSKQVPLNELSEAAEQSHLRLYGHSEALQHLVGGDLREEWKFPRGSICSNQPYNQRNTIQMNLGSAGFGVVEPGHQRRTLNVQPPGHRLLAVP